jgi:hypothetical protein
LLKKIFLFCFKHARNSIVSDTYYKMIYLSPLFFVTPFVMSFVNVVSWQILSQNSDLYMSRSPDVSNFLRKSLELRLTEVLLYIYNDNVVIQKSVKLTVFISKRHYTIHIICIVDNKGRQIFDIHTYIWPFFDLQNTNK